MGDTVQSKTAITTRERVAAPPANGGRLILVTCADLAHLELVLGAATRRLAGSADVVLAEPTVTRRLPAGGGMLVSASQFGAADVRGEFVLTWREGARSFGYPASMLALLSQGLSLVAGIPAGCGAEHAALALWPNLAVIHLEPGTEHLRRGIARAPASERSPLTFAGCAVGSGARLIRVSGAGGLATAVVALSAAIDQAIPKQPVRAPRVPRAAIPDAARALPGARARAATTLRHSPLDRQVPATAAIAQGQLRATSST